MNETTVKQSKRLIQAGCPIVKVTMEGHEIVFNPVPLGRLWDYVRTFRMEGEIHDIPTTLRSDELIEALVRIIENHNIKNQMK